MSKKGNKKKGYTTGRNRKKHRISRGNYIFTEGEQSEPNYIKKFEEKYVETNGLITVEKRCQGRGTDMLVEEALSVVDYDLEKYADSTVWIFFDKDNHSNENFDSCCREITQLNDIKKYKARNIRFYPCWSNPSFEVWILNHFPYTFFNQSTPAELEKKIEKHMRNSNPKFSYKKNDQSLFDTLMQNDGIQHAIKHSKQQLQEHQGKKPSASNPGTRVYEFIEEIMNVTGNGGF